MVAITLVLLKIFRSGLWAVDNGQLRRRGLHYNVNEARPTPRARLMRYE